MVNYRGPGVGDRGPGRACRAEARPIHAREGGGLGIRLMNAVVTALVVFGTLFGATLLGMRLRATLPEHHLAPDAKDAVKVGMGSVATMAALVLGLLVASTKSAYDTERNESHPDGGQD